MSEDATIKHSVDSRIAEKAAFLGFGAFLSKVLGLFRDLIIAQTAPLGVSDAWVLAFRIPHFLRRLSSEGLVNASLFGQKLTWQSFLIWVFIWSIGVSALLFFQAPLLRFLGTPRELEQLSGTLFQGMGFYLWSLGISAYLLTIAHQRGNLWQVALTPVLLNLVIILALLTPFDLQFRLSQSLSWAGGLQLLILLPQLRFLQLSSFKLGISFDKINHLARMVVAFSYLQFLGLFSVLSAAHLGEGALSFFFWAERLLEFPLALISTSLGLAGVAHLAGLGPARRNYLQQSLLWLSPAAVGLLMARNEIVLLLFGKDHFSLADQAEFISLLVPFSFLLFFLGLYKMILWILVAQKAIPSLKVLGGHLVIALILPLILQRQSEFQVRDLAFAYVLSAFLLCLNSFFFLKQRQEILTSLLQLGRPVMFSSALMGLWILGLRSAWEPSTRAEAGVTIAIAGIIYFISLGLLKRMTPERGTLG